MRSARSAWRNPNFDPDPHGRPKTVGDGLAMEKVAVARRRLDRVAQRVPEIQVDPAAARPALALIGDHDLQLGPAGALYDLGRRTTFEGGRIAASDGRPISLEQLEESVVAEGCHLGRLAEGGPELAPWKRSEQVDVDDDRGRLMERADEVLALGQVHPGLAADRRVDLGDERGRKLDERDAAQVGRGQESGRIAERTAPDGDQWLGAFDAESGQLTGSGFDDAEALGVLTLGQQHPLDPQPSSRSPASTRSPTASQAPGSLTRIARRARRASSSAASPLTAIPSPITIRPIGVSARSKVVPETGPATAPSASRSTIVSTTPCTSATPA